MATVPINRSDRFGGIRPNRYRGGGGFSDVYEGFTPSGERVALKVLRFREEKDLTHAEKLNRERKILARINSRGVAKYIDSDLDNDPPWIASEYVEGPTLKEAIATNGPLAPKAVELLIHQIAIALSELHDENIAHRDLSPNNVILGPSGPVIIDFGSARIANSSTSPVSIISVGTPGFLSPEAVTGTDSGIQTDIFALSRIAEYALTGQSETTDPAQLKSLSPNLSSELVMALSEDPNARPTAQSIVEACRIADSNIQDISAASYPTPILKKLPMRFRPRTVMAIFLLTVIVGFFASHSFIEPPITTSSQLNALEALSTKDSDLQWTVIDKPAGLIRGFSIPKSFSEKRVRSTQTPNPLTTDLDAFQIRAEPAPRNTSLHVVASIELNLEGLNYDQIFENQNDINLDNFLTIRDNLISEINFRESNYLDIKCNFSIPENASVNGNERSVFVLSTSVGCDTEEETNVIAIYFYPELNLQVLVTGFFHPDDIDFLAFLDSIRVTNENALVATTDKDNDLLTRSQYPGTTSRMFFFDNGTNEELEESFFYSKLAIWLDKGEAIEVEFSKGQESLYSVWGWTIDDEDGYQGLIPLGRLWTYDDSESRTFSNIDFDSILLIIELDSVTNTRPMTLFRFVPADPADTLYSADAINLGIGTYDESRSFSYLSDTSPQFGLPKNSNSAERSSKAQLSVGGVQFIIPSTWNLNTSPPKPSADLSDFSYALLTPAGKDLSSLEADLPQFEVTSEQLAYTQTHKDTWYWIETDDANCQSRSYFTFEGEDYYVEWVVRLNCMIRDAYSDPGDQRRQIQAAPLFQVLVSKPLDTSSDDWPEPLLRINFTPETREDLVFLREMILSLRPSQ